MGAISGVLNTIGTISSVLGAVNSGFNASRQYKQAQDSYQATEQSIRAQQQIKEKEDALNAGEESRKRRDALRRAVSKQQAAFGAQGIDTTDGSGQAVLLGLFEQSDEEKKYQDRLAQLKKNALEQNVEDQRRRNLLTLQSGYGTARNDALQSGNRLGNLGDA